MNNSTILFGVCGIGQGHIYEMLPIINLYKNKKNRIIIFAFGESYKFYKTHCIKSKNVRVYEVIVPWIHGSFSGINYLKTSKERKNKINNYFERNFLAMDRAFKFGGKPHLVITNYEPISAQYGYSLGCKIVTLEQQSKYLFEGYKKSIAGLSKSEEQARLNMFFPKVDLRIINSFFAFPHNSSNITKKDFVTYGPIIREQILSIKDYPDNRKDVLVYLSPYSNFVQTPNQVLTIFKRLSDYKFYLFCPQKKDFIKAIKKLAVKNVKVQNYNNKNFIEALKNCGSAITTSGHTLLSELLYLNKPIFAVPLNTYEQHYSAYIVNKGRFGISSNKLDQKKLSNFLKSLPTYRKNIILNKHGILLKGSAQQQIIEKLNSLIKHDPE